MLPSSFWEGVLIPSPFRDPAVRPIAGRGPLQEGVNDPGQQRRWGCFYVMAEGKNACGAELLHLGFTRCSLVPR